jgi:MinD-like ATPase involved in chromosome partitioning or flagellar assembly
MKYFIKESCAGQRPEPGHFHPRVLPELEALYSALRPILEAKRPFIYMGASGHGEGVSTVSWGLAYYLAMREGEECLFVDGDIARPTIRNTSGMPPQGLGEYLRGEADFRMLPFATELTDLAAVHAGHSSRSFVKLSDEQAESFIAEATRYYRAVVFNGRPGCDKYVELWARRSDAVLLLASYRSTKREILLQTLRGFKAAGIPISGLVFNKQEHPIPEFLYRRL